MITSFNPQQSQMRQKQAFGTGISPEAFQILKKAAQKKYAMAELPFKMRDELAKDGKNLRIATWAGDNKTTLMLQEVGLYNGLIAVKKSAVLAESPKEFSLLPTKKLTDVEQALLEITPDSITESAKKLSKEGPFAGGTFYV